MNSDAFLADLEAKPAALRALAGRLRQEDPWARVPAAQRILFLGMGSSRYAADVAAARLRAAGVDAVAEYASGEASSPPGESTLVAAISATASSRETLGAVSRYTGRSPVVALTNAAGAGVPDAEYTVRYQHDEDPDVALLTETLVAELIAQRWWALRVMGDVVNGVFRVAQGLIEQAPDVGAAQPVEPGTAVGPLFDDSGQPELAQVLAGGGRGAAGRLG